MCVSGFIKTLNLLSLIVMKNYFHYLYKIIFIIIIFYFYPDT